MIKKLKYLNDMISGWRTVIWNILTGVIPLYAELESTVRDSGIDMTAVLSPFIDVKYLPAIFFVNVMGNFYFRYITKGPIGDKSVYKE